MKKRNKIATICLAGALAVTTPVMASSEDLILGTADADSVYVGIDEGWDIIFGTGESEEIITGTEDVASISNTSDLYQSLNQAVSYLANTVTSPVVDTIGGEWSVMSMARNGSLSETTENNYRVNLGNTLEKVSGKLHSVKYTEYSRVIMALASIGIDAHNVNGYDLVQPLAEFDKVTHQGINGPVFALIALDSRNYEVPVLNAQQTGTQTSRDGIISYILSKQLSEGGWALNGNEPDDLTPMAIQALAPYYGRADVQAAVDKALDRWSKKQLDNGGYGSSDWGGGSETISQTIIALSALNIDIEQDSRFIKNGNSLLDALLTYQLSDGSFEHIKGKGSDLMATDQSTLALTAYSRFLNNQTRLYDMTDVPLQGGGEESSEDVTIFRNRLYHIPEVPTLADRDEIMALDAELITMGDFAEKEEFSAFLRKLKDEIKCQQEAVEALDQYIWDNVHPSQITLQNKKAVKEARKRYMDLPKENREFLKYASDILDAENEILKLENGGAVFAGMMEEPEIILGIQNSETAPENKPEPLPARRPGTLQAAGGSNRGPAPAAVKTETASNTVDAKVENGVIAAASLEEIKGQDKNLKTEGELEKDKKYTMTIHGKDIETAQDMNSKLSMGSGYEGDINKLAEKAVIFHFEEKGKFPGPVQVELPVSLENGDYLLLKYDSENRQAEFVQKIQVEDGNTKFIVSEGGDYFIAKKAKSQSLNEIEEKEDKEAVKAEEKDTTIEETQVIETEEHETEECETEDVIEKEKASNPWPVVAGVVGVVVILVAGINFWLNKKRGLR